MAELMTKLEQATEGSRELDAEIATAIRYMDPKAQEWMRRWENIGPMPNWPGRIACWHSDGQVAVHWDVPHYTTSLDAALTLVPEGAEWNLIKLLHPDDMVGYSADVGLPTEVRWFQASARTTPALALCIAALKARATNA
jgi:hypothetical protein